MATQIKGRVFHVCVPAQANVDWTCNGCGRHMPKRWSLILSRAEIQIVIDALASNFHRVINADLDRAEGISHILDRAVDLADYIDDLERAAR